MIQEEGVVVEVRAGIAYVKAERSSSCNKCSSSKTCKTLTDNAMIVEAENPLSAKAGDNVVFTVGETALLKASAIAYLVPLAAFITGVVLGQVFSAKINPAWNADLTSAALGFGFLLAAFLAVYLLGRRASAGKIEMPTIIKII